MKKKEKFLFVILLSLSLSAISTNAFGQTTYTCKAKEGDEFIFSFTELDAYYAFLRGYRLGDKSKIKIIGVTEDTNDFIIETDIWDPISKNESFRATADYQATDYVYKDSSRINPDILFYVLSPVSNYLAEYAEANPDYSSSGNVLTRTGFRLEFGEYIYSTTFDSNGIASKFHYSNSTTVLYVLIRSGSSSSIPGYDLPISIGLTAIAGLSIICIVKKKMLN